MKDVLEKDVNEKYYLSDKMMSYFKNRAANFNNGKINIRENDDKATTITASSASCDISDNFVCVASRERNPENPTSREPGLPTEQQLEARGDGKTICLTSVQKDNLIIHNMMPRSSKSGKGGTGHLTRNDGKTYCLDTGNTNAVEKNQTIRRLTPIECERLQCVPDNYTNHVSDTQRYRMLGNGWNVEVIAHIFNFLKPFM